MIVTKICSSLVKCFIDEDIKDKPELRAISGLRNERLSFQLLCAYDGDEVFLQRLGLRIDAAPQMQISVRSVEQVPSMLPVYRHKMDENYLRTEAGLYPDLLLPLQYGGAITVVARQLRAYWVELEVNGAPPGEYDITLALMSGDQTAAQSSLRVEVIDAYLPHGDFIVTQWFHCDCLANYYNVTVFSEQHWRIIENFVRTASRNGQNMLLTPIFTPPLDTAPGGERTTVQLVRIEVTDGAYTFDFSLLDRWIDMCLRCGIEYFEMSHLFTQWGAAHAPKIVATVNGEEKRIFGWETDSCSEQYRQFLRALLPRLTEHLKKRGIDKRCYFHISDEPNISMLEKYAAAKSGVADMLSDYIIMDALSDFEFYKTGVITHPIPSVDHMEKFIEANVQKLWTYYCCGQTAEVTNRLMAMPSARNRIIAQQLYKYNIAGFLQWGYNFYNNCTSADAINPFADTTGGFWTPSGDCFSVYPAQNGEALESLRLCVFHEALQDLRAMKLCEELYGRDFVLRLIEEESDGEITFKKYPHGDEYILNTREKINRAIRDFREKVI